MAPSEGERLMIDLIVAGYRRKPQSDDEVTAAHTAGVRAISAEPW